MGLAFSEGFAIKSTLILLTAPQASKSRGKIWGKESDFIWKRSKPARLPTQTAISLSMRLGLFYVGIGGEAGGGWESKGD